MNRPHDVILHVELSDTTTWQRQVLSENLRERQWTPVGDSEEVWIVQMMSGSDDSHLDDETLLQAVQADLSASAEAAGVETFEGVCVLN